MASDDDSSNTSGGDQEVTLYSCRLCPGQKFTAPERDNHRLQHKREKDQGQKKRGKGRPGRSSSPTRSELTLFDVIGDDEDAVVASPSPKPKSQKETTRKPSASPGPASKKAKKKEESARGREKRERRKRQSVKLYDNSVVHTRNNGA